MNFSIEYFMSFNQEGNNVRTKVKLFIVVSLFAVVFPGLLHAKEVTEKKLSTSIYKKIREWEKTAKCKLTYASGRIKTDGTIDTTNGKGLYCSTFAVPILCEVLYDKPDYSKLKYNLKIGKDFTRPDQWYGSEIAIFFNLKAAYGTEKGKGVKKVQQYKSDLKAGMIADGVYMFDMRIKDIYLKNEKGELKKRQYKYYTDSKKTKKSSKDERIPAHIGFLIVSNKKATGIHFTRAELKDDKVIFSETVKGGLMNCDFNKFIDASLYKNSKATITLYKL